MEPQAVTTHVIGRWERSKEILRFMARSQFGLATASLALTTAVILSLSWTFGWGSGDAWSWLQNISTSLTLVVAFLIWVGERAQDWQLALPKRLTAEFKFSNETVMVCKGAYLTGEDDIRAWAQQLGWQMANEQLSLFPNMVQFGPEVEWDQAESPHHFRHYRVELILRTLPASIEALKKADPNGAPWVQWARPHFTDPRWVASMIGEKAQRLG